MNWKPKNIKPYYEDESVFLIHGDCMEVMPKLDMKFDLVLTSPPYNMKLRISKNKYCKRSQKENGFSSKYLNYSDDLSVEEYYQFQKKTIDNLLKLSKQSFYIIQPLTGNKEALWRLIGTYHKEIKEIIIWDKLNTEPAIHANVLNSQFEFIIIFDSFDSRKRAFDNSNFVRGTLSNIFKIHKSRNKIKGHSATFPIELVAKIIDNFTIINEWILDPFAGTGTTGRTCKDLGRKCIIIEQEEAYCEIIANRMLQEVLF